jgi:hypothetical protein
LSSDIIYRSPMRKYVLACLYVGCLLLTTCRDIESVTPNREPVADAGSNATINIGAPLALDGSRSSDPDGDRLSYEWRILTQPANSQATILPFDSVKSIFTPDRGGVYTITLVVTDNIAVASDTLDIQVFRTNGAPVANAGADVQIATGSTMQLHGSGTDPDGDTLTYLWSIVQKPPTSTAALVDADKLNASFVPDKDGPYFLTLRVSDETLFSIDSVLVTASSKGNKPPVANAGQDIMITTGTTAPLTGSGSDPDNESVTFLWSIIQKPVGSVVTIKDPDKPQASFIAEKDGIYLATLNVSDGSLSDTDTVQVTATSKANNPPIADAGKDGTTNLGEVYNLVGSGSDPDGSNVTYLWTLTNRPVGSTAIIQNNSSPHSTFIADRPGTYIATLTVSDGSLTAADPVTITTSAVNITGINPTSGAFGITVKISGINFSNVPSENTVVFGKTAAVVSAASYTGLDVVVPKGAGTGTVFVTVNGITDNGPLFTYIESPVVSTLSQFNAPYAMTSDAQGNLFIADYTSHVIRKLTPAGVLTTIAGTGAAGYLDAKPNQAMFNRPAGIAYDQQADVLYISDNGNHCIRKLDLGAGVVTTFAGFPQAGFNDATGQQAQFNLPVGLAIDQQGNLFVGDLGNHRLRRITPGAVVTTFAGSGSAGFADGGSKAAQFNGIAGVAVSSSGFVYVADGLNHRIRRVDGQGNVSTLAGNGTVGFVNGNGTVARFSTPYSVSCNQGGEVYVADFNNHSIRKITPAGDVTTVAGNGASGFVDGAGTTARFNMPIGVATAPNNLVYVADYGNQRVRRILFE